MIDFLALFTSARDIDIANFVKTKALIYEKVGKSRTFLISTELGIPCVTPRSFWDLLQNIAIIEL